MDKKISLGSLRERLGTIYDLGSTAGLLSWDRQTKMPPGGLELRAE
jgi:Zn-dependent M32 family carboxypeptidase